MFDMKKIGRNIAQLRKKSDITQMGLADKLGISYQAISHWERGETMPDISKLPQLAEIFDVSIDEILDKSKETLILKNVIENNASEYIQHGAISVEEFASVAPLLKKEQADEVVESFKAGLNTTDILSIAPFVSDEVLDECAKKAFELHGIKELTAIAPFVSDEVLDECAKKAFEMHGIKELTAIAPFLSDEVLDECAKKAFELHGIKELTAIAPFLSVEVLDECAKKAFEESIILN